MPTQDLPQSGGPAAQDFAQDLKIQAAAVQPCLTILLSLPEPLETRTRLKNAIRRAQSELKQRGLHAEEIGALMTPVEALARRIEGEGRWGNGLVVLRSPTVFRHFWVHKIPEEMVAVSDQFPVRRLLSWFNTTRLFYVLALNQKHVELLRCTGDGWEPVKLADAVPSNLKDWLNTRQPDHVLDNHSFGGASAGSMKGVVFGTSTDREKRDQFLLHFYKEIDRGIHPVLKDSAAPLVLVGVEYEVALYRKVSTYPRLMEDAVQGSPNGAKADTHQSALKIVQRYVPEPLQNALALLERRRGSGRALFDPGQILQAAREGRVADLFLRQSGAAAEDDRMDAAAIQTLLHGGRIFVLSEDQMPGRAAVAAGMRY